MITSVETDFRTCRIQARDTGLFFQGFLGEAVYGDKGRPAPGGGAVVAASVDTAAAVAEAPAPAPAAKAPVNRDWLTFLTAFGLLVREGLEAIPH